MKRPAKALGAGICLSLSLLSGCVSPPPPKDYTAFKASAPRSILVLPPKNETVSVEGPYSYLSTVSRPLSELGYYVFPVNEVDELLKANGVTDPAEMHQIPVAKLREVTGADAVLDPALKEYGSKYVLLDSVTSVSVSAVLVDARSGETLWSNQARLQMNANGNNQGGLLAQMVGAIVSQIINSKSDPAHRISQQVDTILFETQGQGLLPGPYLVGPVAVAPKPAGTTHSNQP